MKLRAFIADLGALWWHVGADHAVSDRDDVALYAQGVYPSDPGRDGPSLRGIVTFGRATMADITADATAFAKGLAHAAGCELDWHGQRKLTRLIIDVAEGWREQDKERGQT